MRGHEDGDRIAHILEEAEALGCVMTFMNSLSDIQVTLHVVYEVVEVERGYLEGRGHHKLVKL